MAKHCERCGSKLSLFEGLSRKALCSSCITKEEAENAQKMAEKNKKIIEISNQIAVSKDITPDQIIFLKKCEKKEQINLYDALWIKFERDKELDKSELETLINLQNDLELSNSDVHYEERVMPYQYVYLIKNEKMLPKVSVRFEDGGSIILKKGEIVHFATSAILKEIKSVNLGYQGGSQGVSIRVMKGVSYRVGSHRGHVVKEERLVASSRGDLILTNKRIILNPAPGNKAVNIQLSKIVLYKCYENGVEIHKEGREKAFFFQTDNSGTSEILGLCLGFLFQEQE